MIQSVLDLCRFDEIVFDYKTFILPDTKASRLQITVDRKTILAASISVKTNLETVISRKTKNEVISGSKVEMAVEGGNKSFMDIELIGGGI